VLGDLTPEYELDPVEGRLFFKDGKRRIIGHRF
jgi:hypothetical protein